MPTKTSLIFVSLLLLPGCAKKPPEAKAKDSAAAQDAGAEALNPPGPGPSPTQQKSGEGGGASEAASADADGGTKTPAAPAVPPKVLKTQVITISMGAQDYDVIMQPEKTAWRISMKSTPGDLASLAQRAKSMPDAEDGRVKVFLGNSVAPATGQAMVAALKAAGFKEVSMELPRRP